MLTIPENLQELQQRCQQITDLTIGHLAEKLDFSAPQDLLHAKGWMGQLIEAFLGANSGNKAQPDFPHLGIELKTIPVNSNYKPLESTYVCTVQTNEQTLAWHESWVYRKLKCVLWVPILATANNQKLAITQRIIKEPIFWSMDNATEEVLRIDWEELMELLQLGHGKNLTAKFGTFLHIRPKAANSKILQDYINADGSKTKIIPRGFYLRTQFTADILENRFLTQNT